MSETPVADIKQAADNLAAGRVALATAREQETQAQAALTAATATVAAKLEEQNALQAAYDVANQAVKDSAAEGTDWATTG